jgi:hypothetical protein
MTSLLASGVVRNELFCTVFAKAMSESIDISGGPVDPSNQMTYLDLWSGLGQTRWFTAIVKSSPESTDGVAFQGGGRLVWTKLNGTPPRGGMKCMWKI